MASVDVLSQWVDVTVLGEEPSVDTEFITHLRTHHRICTSEEDEPKYELVVPGPEDGFASGGPTRRPLISFLCMRVWSLVWAFFSLFQSLKCLYCVIAEWLPPSFTPTLGVF